MISVALVWCTSAPGPRQQARLPTSRWLRRPPATPPKRDTPNQQLSPTPGLLNLNLLDSQFSYPSAPLQSQHPWPRTCRLGKAPPVPHSTGSGPLTSLEMSDSSDSLGKAPGVPHSEGRGPAAHPA